MFAANDRLQRFGRMRQPVWSPYGEMLPAERSFGFGLLGQTLEQFVKVTYPVGGETFPAKSEITITWQTDSSAPKAAKVKQTKISFTKDGKTWILIKTLPGNPGSFKWKLPDVKKSQMVVVKVVLLSGTGVALTRDQCDSPFNVIPVVSGVVPTPSETVNFVKIIYPNGGETFLPDSTITIRWETQAVPEAAKVIQTRIAFTFDGKTWQQVAVLPGNPNGYNWKAPKVKKTKMALIRVSLISKDGKVLARDRSDAPFTIYAPVEVPEVTTVPEVITPVEEVIPSAETTSVTPTPIEYYTPTYAPEAGYTPYQEEYYAEEGLSPTEESVTVPTAETGTPVTEAGIFGGISTTTLLLLGGGALLLYFMSKGKKWR